MIQIIANNNDCSTCAHSNVCAYKSVFENTKQKIRNDEELRDTNINSPISCEVKCEEYTPAINANYRVGSLESGGSYNIALCKDTVTSNGVPFPKPPEPEVYKETFGSLERVNSKNK